MPTDLSTPPTKLGKPDGDAFVHVDTLQHQTTGVIAKITVRQRDGRVTFSIAREYEADGRTQQTSFLKKAHIPALRAILDDLDERLEQLEDEARAKKR